MRGFAAPYIKSPLLRGKGLFIYAASWSDTVKAFIYGSKSVKAKQEFEGRQSQTGILGSRIYANAKLAAYLYSFLKDAALLVLR